MQTFIRNSNLATRFVTTAIIIMFTSLDSFSQQAWTQVPTPDTSASRNILSGISGTSSSDVWAVGHFETITPGELKNLLMHWDGSGWQTFGGTDMSSSYNDLWDVAAISTNNVWAVGTYNDPGTTRSQLIHWNGTSWSHTALPNIPGGSFLFSIDAIAANDIWAVGGQAGSPTRPGYTIHYDGSNWTEFSAANPGTFRNYFSAVDGIASNDVWAVGYFSDAYGDFHAMAQHWNGNNWTNFQLPSTVASPLGELLSVTMISSNDVWALGSTITGVMLMIHWDGNNWSEISSNGAAGGMIIKRGSDVFAVGDRISQWNGSSWFVIDSLNQLSYPSLVSAVSFSNGDIWASGRTFDNAFHNLVYRTANATPVFVNGTAQVLNTAINYSPHNIDDLLEVQDADLSQVVTYSLITPPSHGTINGLPDTAITSNGFAISSGVTYTRDNNYTGGDQFVVRSSVGPLISQTTINVAPLAPLPVIISNYSVIKTGLTATIKWSTLTEINTKEFLIERSSDGINFTTISRIPTRGSAYDYKIIDPMPLPGLNFYRLILIDVDGKQTFFPIKSLQFDIMDLKPIVVYPNPVVDKILNIHFNVPGNYVVLLYNQQGQKLIDKMIDASASSIQIKLPENIPAGVYVLSLINSKTVLTEKIFVR